LHPETGRALETLVASARASVEPVVFETTVLRIAQVLGVDRAVVEELVPIGTAASVEQFGALAAWPSAECFTDKQRLAIGYAEQFVVDHTRLGQSDIDRMLEVFEVDEFFRFQVAIGAMERVLRFCRIFEVAPAERDVS
jgi:alkylhydroperoxidase family enzyme